MWIKNVLNKKLKRDKKLYYKLNFVFLLKENLKTSEIKQV